MCTFFKGVQRTQTVEGWTLLHIYPMSDGILVPCKVVLSYGKCQDFCKHHRANDRNRTTIQIRSTCEQSKPQFINSPTPNLGFLSVSPRREEGSEGRRENFSQTHLPAPHSSILINNHKSPRYTGKGSCVRGSKVLILYIRWEQKQGNEVASP